MKKMIVWLLMVTMLLGVFAGCDGTTAQTPTSEPTTAAGDLEGINAAIDYLKAFYKDEGSETFTDFERFGVVRIAGVAYTVVWTADVSEDLVKAVVNDDGTVTIDVNESNETETTYVLTATVTDDAGNTASYSWSYILPVGIGNDYSVIVDMAYELEKDQAMEFPSTLVGTVTAINTAWDDAYQNITVTIVVEGREDKPIMCYRLKGDGAQDLAPGDLITVTGILKNYNGTIEFDSGCTLDKVEKGAGTLGDIPTDPLEIVDAAYALEVGASLPYSATLTGEVVSIDDPYSAQYNNITVSIKVAGREDKPIKCYRMKGEGADTLMPGDTITVTGVIKNYNGTIEFDTGCSLDKVEKGENSFVMPTDPKEIVNLAYELGVGEALPVQVTLSGLIFAIDTPYSDNYNNISVWMVVEGMYDKPIQAFRMKGAGVDQIWEWDTITVTGTLKNYNGTIEFDAGCTLDSWVDTGLNPDIPSTQKEIVDALYALGQGESMPGIYSLTGVVTSAPEYSLNYGNQTLTIRVEGKSVTCYRMTTGGKMDIAVGDTVTVRGNLEDYKGQKQLTSGYLTYWEKGNGQVVNPDEPPVVAIADGTYVIWYAAEGKALTALKDTYTYGYMDGTNVTYTNGVLSGYTNTSVFTITNGANGFTLTDCYGRQVYMTGTYNSFNVGTAPASGADWVALDGGNGSYYVKNVAMNKYISFSSYGNYGAYADPGTNSILMITPASAVAPEQPEQPEVPEEELKTLEQQLAAAAKLANGQYLSVESTITGTVVINDAYSTQYGNITFTVTNTDGTSVYCYRVKGTGMDTLADGDTVTVTGNLTAYNGKAQFDSKATVTVVAKAEKPEEPEKPTDPSEPEVPGETKTYTFTFSFASAKTNDLTAAELMTAFTNSVLSVDSASCSKVYPGNPSSGQFQGANFLKFGSSSVNGVLNLNFPSNVKISKVVLNCHGWNTSSNNTITVNDCAAQTAPKTGSAADLVFELANPTNALTITTNKRAFVFSITVTYTE